MILAKTSVEDVYAFSFEDDSLVYSPLDKVLLRISNQGLDRLNQHIDKDHWKATLDPSGQYGLFSTSPPELYPYVSDAGYNGLVYLCTNQCNMKCSYCYAASSHKECRYISQEVWKPSVDYFFENLSKDCNEVSLALHGYGECSTNPLEIKEIVNYFKSAAYKHSKTTVFQITTNGLFDIPFADFLIANKFTINLSLDGNKNIHDISRKDCNGKGTYERIENIVRYMLNSPIASQILARTTITSTTVQQMLDIVIHFKDIGIQLIHFEPVDLWGAASDYSQDYRPSMEMFVEQIKRCILWANKHNVRIYYGPINFGIGIRFCSSKDKLTIDYSGRIVSCVEATPESGIDIFHVGNFEGNIAKFNHKHMNILNSTSVFDYKECMLCLLKYHCAGNCLSYRHRKDWKTRSSFRNLCKYNELLFAWLLKRLSRKESVDSILDFPVNRLL